MLVIETEAKNNEYELIKRNTAKKKSNVSSRRIYPPEQKNTFCSECNANNNVIRCHVTRITECNVITIPVITRNKSPSSNFIQ